jgi:hypothetical protein
VPQRSTGGDQTFVGRHFRSIDEAPGDRLLSLQLDRPTETLAGRDDSGRRWVLRAGTCLSPATPRIPGDVRRESGTVPKLTGPPS